MKIVLVGPLPEPINGCSYANQVFCRLAGSAGHVVSKINTATSDISGRQGSMFSWRKGIAFLQTYRRLPQLFRADVVYCTPGQTYFGLLKYAPFLILTRMLHIPYVLHLHGNHLGAHYASLQGIRRRVFHYLVANASAGIVLSDSLRANFDGLLPSDRVHVVANFAGDQLFSLSPFPKSDSRLEIVYLSNLMREKGIVDLLDALSRLKRAGVPFSARIAGHVEDEVKTDVQARLTSLSPEVKYIGPVVGDAKVRLLQQSNVLVLPTYYTMEGQPIALLEGMATGSILVTTRHAGIPDIVDESNGYLLAPHDVGALAKCLERIAHNLPGELMRVSRHNMESAARLYTEQAFAEKILEVLDKAVRKCRKVRSR